MTNNTGQCNLPLFDKTSWSDSSFREAFSSPGILRNHWKPLIAALQARGEESLAQDHNKAVRMRHDDGATINPFENFTKQETPWELDIIPLPISPGEWTYLEQGLIQRATLLERVLKDVYGEQELLRKGFMPPELVHANPNFLHSCHGIRPSGNRHLTFYAADVYRMPNGGFKVLRDYGGCPAGLGYALENRIVISRLFPELYHQSQIRRLAPFFQAFHHALIKRASLRKDDPGIAIISTGPDDPLYFEHALLSRYLGYPLVEGQDLTVRNGKVYLKKLAGLEPVEALFRHVTDLYSDPFTLRRGTSHGVAGLIQVCREQNIDVINPIGSGFIDTPVLSLFLATFCRQLLGEDLRLTSHGGWWCNSDEGLEKALSQKLELIPAFVRSLSAGNLDLMTMVQEIPMKFMVSAPFSPSSAPSWNGQQVTSSRTVLRLFACATEEGFTIMPGGLAITSGTKETLVNGELKHQQSKDLWVMSEGPVAPFTLMENFNVIPEFRRSSDLPSRVADNLLWLGRYLERAESLIRLLRPVYSRLASEKRLEEMSELEFLLNILRSQQVLLSTGKEGQSSYSYNELHNHLHDALYDQDRPNSVIALLHNVKVTARNVRDRLSTDSFRIINRLEEYNNTYHADPLDLLDQTLFTLSGFSGMAMESMTRGLGWCFMDMGRRIERGINQATLIRMSLPHVCTDARSMLQALLEVSDSLMTYRGRYRSTFQLGPVLDLLLIDESNPKSLAFQLMKLAEHVETLPRPGELKFTSTEERLALEMLTTVRLLDLKETGCDNQESNSRLSSFLKNLDQLLIEFSQQVTAHYLSRVPATPHFGIVEVRPDI